MRSFTHEPKALLPVNGRPLLAHQLDWLKAGGFTEVFLLLGYQAQRIQAVFEDGAKYGLRLHYRVESSPLGTAGAVCGLGSAVVRDLLVVYGDLLLDFDLGALMRAHAAAKPDATLVVRPTDHPEDSDLADVLPDGRIAWVGRLEEKHLFQGERLGCCAVWIVSPALLAAAPSGAPSDFARDLFPRALARGKRLRAHRVEGGVLDIGTPERYAKFCGERA